MIQGQNIGKLPNVKLPVSTQILIAISGLAIVGTIAYIIYKNNKKGKGDKGAGELAKNTDLTKVGIENIAKQVPKKDLEAVKKSLNAFDPKPIADMIYNAHGLWNDEEDVVYNAFNMLKNRAELSLLSSYFEGLYKVGLFVYLQRFLNANELAKVNDITKKLPTY